MKASTLTVHWHNDNQPIYTAHFQPGSHSISAPRLATGGGDNNVRLWRLVPSSDGTDIRSVTYLCTLAKHTQAVNVVRFDPRGDFLASAGDDGNVIVWTLNGSSPVAEFGAPELDEKESWRVKHVCHASGSEIYDLCWSPDSKFILAGSMDNIARIYDAGSGQLVRQIAEHNHYVQGVCWDPLNEYLATQSSDRSVHIYTLKTRDGQFSLNSYNKCARFEYVRRAVSPSGSAGGDSDESTMQPPQAPQQSQRKPPPSPGAAVAPLPAVKPMESAPIATKLSLLYHNETLASFFRRLTFSPDGSLLLTPSGIYKEARAGGSEEMINTVYIYSRSGLNRSPVAHLPGMKKPSLAVKFSPVLYELRSTSAAAPTANISVGARESGDSTSASASSASASTAAPSGEAPVFDLPYRMVYAVATQDSAVIYDTQQRYPLAVVSNLHYATFTDLAWSPEGNTLFITSTDGFCSVVCFQRGELGVPCSEAVLNAVRSGRRRSLPPPPTPPRFVAELGDVASPSGNKAGRGGSVSDVEEVLLPTVSPVPEVAAVAVGGLLSTPPCTPLGAPLLPVVAGGSAGGAASGVSGGSAETTVKESTETSNEAANSSASGADGAGGAGNGMTIGMEVRMPEKKRRRVAPTLVQELKKD